MNHVKGAFRPPEGKRGKATSSVSSFLLSFFLLCLPSPSVPALPSRGLCLPLVQVFLWGQGLACLCHGLPETARAAGVTRRRGDRPW